MAFVKQSDSWICRIQFKLTEVLQNEITYTQQGNYLLPDLELPEQPKVEIGIWGKRHERYIKQHHKLRYFNLLTSCKFTAYLADIDEQAEDMFFRLVQQLAEKESITEQLKADNQMLWIRRMNNIHNRVTEIVNNELIFVLNSVEGVLRLPLSRHKTYRSAYNDSYKWKFVSLLHFQIIFKKFCEYNKPGIAFTNSEFFYSLFYL